MNPVIQYTVSCATYNGDLADHSIHNLMDDNPKTNWTEGEDGLGEGESIEFLFREPYLVDSVSIRNGNHASKQRYLDNARPERMTLSFSDGTSETFVLRDEMELQIMDLPKPVETEFVKLTFDSVYPGARYEDTVISDVAFEAYEIRRDTVQVSGEGSVCGRIQVQTRYQLGKTDTEQTTIVGTDKNGDVIWTYDTNQCVSEYLESVIALLVRDNTLYFSNQGTVTALNIQDGTVRWSNSEFGGYPTDWVLDEEGNLYLCGYQSPDLFVVDAQGNTTLRVQQFDKAYYWPSQLTLSDNKLMIQMDGHPDNIAPGSSVISLDLISKGYELPLPSNWHSPW